jgi:hypothetical protein
MAVKGDSTNGHTLEFPFLQVDQFLNMLAQACEIAKIGKDLLNAL